MVFRTGGRTLGVCAAFILAAALSIAALPAGHAAASYAPSPTALPTEPEDQEPTGESTEYDPAPAEEDQSPAEDDSGYDDDGRETLAPQPGSPAPDEETSSPDESDRDQHEDSEPSPTPSAEDDVSEGQTTEEEDHHDSLQHQAEAEVTCEEPPMLSPGETVAVDCGATPAEATLSPGSLQASHGELSFDGSRLTFTAAADLRGTPQEIVVITATHPDYVAGSAEVTFTVAGHRGDDAPGQDSGGAGEPAERPPHTEGAGPDSTANSSPTVRPPPPGPEGTYTPSPSAEPSDPAQAPDSPAAPDRTGELDQLETLPPVPGGPSTLWEDYASADAPEEPSEAPRSDEDSTEAAAPDPGEELLSATGADHLTWVASLVLAAMVLGAAALRVAHRPSR